MILYLATFPACVSRPRYRTAPPKPRDDGKSSPSKPNGAPISRKGAHQIGLSSYYAHKFHGRPTASGEIFDMNGLTAAHRELPLGTVVRVTHLGNGRHVVVKINDRGPFVEGRILDLSLGAAKKLDMIREGVALVKIDILEAVQ